ncbi:hypothetical protein H2200_008494 [Cladophialophora chaetospira]|uniref:Uncharacterized protein n=1 Tax=Cladophialophora chaetospira TaxID=386627 RepID=A0AA39CGN1_9EURO|nr:hypothetical protein H2200_008494 [Cladophialophora chaetospira]
METAPDSDAIAELYLQYHDLLDNAHEQNNPSTISPTSSASATTKQPSAVGLSSPTHHMTEACNARTADTEAAETLLPHTLESDTPKRLKVSSIQNVDDDVLVAQRSSKPAWRPFWLRKAILLSFAMLFLLMAATSVFILVYSLQHHGIAATLTTNQYTWKYGPTALLTVVLVLWRQVEYTCKVITPWKQLQSELSDVERTTKIDYLSPVFPIVLWRSVRFRHYTVTCSVVAAVLLQIAIILSTTLLTRIDGETKLAGTALKINSSVTLGQNSLHNFSATPSTLYFLHLKYGQTLPPGTGEGVAFDDVDPVDFQVLHHGSVVQATVNAFVPAVDCRSVNARFEPFLDNQACSATAFRIYLDYPNCTIDRPSSDMNDDYFGTTWGAVSKYKNNSTPLVVTRVLDCNKHIPSAQLQKSTHRMFAIFRIEWLPLLASDIPETCLKRPEDWSSAYKPVPTMASVVVCNIRRRITQREIQTDLNTPWHLMQSTRGINVAPKVDVEGDVFVDDLDSSLRNSALFATQPTEFGDYATTWQMAMLSQNVTRPSSFFNASLLAAGMSDVYRNIAALWAHQMVREPSNQTIIPTVLVNVPRLEVQHTTSGLLICIFVLEAGLCFAIASVGPGTTISKRPDFTIRAAELLATSSELMEMTRKGVIIDRSRGTARSASFFQLACCAEGKARGQEKNVFSRSKCGPLATQYWAPFAASYWFAAVTSATLVGIIAILEALQRLSDHGPGFVFVKGSGKATSFWASALSAGLMTAVAVSFDMLYFVITLLTPYKNLCKGSDRSDRLLLSRVAGRLPGELQVVALGLRQYPVFFISLATLLGGLLNIIVSGLFVVVTSTSARSTTATVTNRVDLASFYFNNTNFTSSLPDSAQDNAVGSVFSASEIFNLSLPAYTFADISFPPVDFSQAAMALMNGTMTTAMPAIHAYLDCSLVPQENMTLYYGNYSTLNRSIYPTWGRELFGGAVQAKIGLPPGCESTGSNDTFASLVSNFQSYWHYVPIAQNSSFDMTYTENEVGFGMGLTLMREAPPENSTEDWGPALGIINSQMRPILLKSTSPLHCPSLAFMIGYFEPNNTVLSNVTVATCSQHLEEISPVDVTFDLPSMRVASARPAANSTRKYLGPVNVDIYSSALFRFNPVEELDPVGLKSITGVSNPAQYGIDTWSQNLFYGKHGVPPDDLLGPQNRQHFVSATNAMYQRYMAQYVSINGWTRATAARSFPANVTNASQLRLAQRSQPKLILQSVLGTMLLLGAISCLLLGRMDKVLVCNPCSNAGQMALFLHSRIVSAGIVGQGELSDEELKKRLMGRGVKLGWWSSPAKYECGGSDGTVPDDHGATKGSSREERWYGIDLTG